MIKVIFYFVTARTNPSPRHTHTHAPLLGLAAIKKGSAVLLNESTGQLEYGVNMDLQLASAPRFDGDGWCRNAQMLQLECFVQGILLTSCLLPVALSLSQEDCVVLSSIFSPTSVS